MGRRSSKPYVQVFPKRPREYAVEIMEAGSDGLKKSIFLSAPEELRPLVKKHVVNTLRIRRQAGQG